MMVVRPCRASDLAGVEKVVTQNVARISSVPHNRDKLSERIDHSIRSFAQDASVEGMEFYLFVLEDPETGEIRGTSGIAASAGNGQPFFNYRLDDLIHSSQQLNVHQKVPVLYLSHALTGKTQLSSFAIESGLHGTEAFSLLSRARLLFIKQHREKFGDEVIVELQGVVDENGDSPFWDSLGRHFFAMDYATIEQYQGIKSRSFITEMMPPHPIYVPLLSEAARQVLGQPDSSAEETCRLLYREGFKPGEFVDIFDGGPTLSAPLEQLQTIVNARTKSVKPTESSMGLRYLVSNPSFDEFRCTLGQLTDGIGDTLRLNSQVVSQLGLEDGDEVHYVAV